jgi:protein O-GlcNAc transferase
MRGRLASGIIERIGLPDLVADDVDAYVDFGVRLCTDRSFRDDIRMRVRRNRSVAYGDDAPTRAFEERVEH